MISFSKWDSRCYCPLLRVEPDYIATLSVAERYVDCSGSYPVVGTESAKEIRKQHSNLEAEDLANRKRMKSICEFIGSSILGRWFFNTTRDEGGTRFGRWARGA